MRPEPGWFEATRFLFRVAGYSRLVSLHDVLQRDTVHGEVGAVVADAEAAIGRPAPVLRDQLALEAQAVFVDLAEVELIVEGKPAQGHSRMDSLVLVVAAPLFLQHIDEQLHQHIFHGSVVLDVDGLGVVDVVGIPALQVIVANRTNIGEHLVVPEAVVNQQFSGAELHFGILIEVGDGDSQADGDTVFDEVITGLGGLGGLDVEVDDGNAAEQHEANQHNGDDGALLLGDHNLFH